MVGEQLIDPVKLDALRRELGSNFVRVLGYFREDGARSIAAMEGAAGARSAVALVRPAHTLKGDALQFGATALADVAEWIENAARGAVEDHVYPEETLVEVLRLRPLFTQTVGALTREVSAVSALRRAVGFGRKIPMARS